MEVVKVLSHSAIRFICLLMTVLIRWKEFILPTLLNFGRPLCILSHFSVRVYRPRGLISKDESLHFDLDFFRLSRTSTHDLSPFRVDDVFLRVFTTPNFSSFEGRESIG